MSASCCTDGGPLWRHTLFGGSTDSTGAGTCDPSTLLRLFFSSAIISSLDRFDREPSAFGISSWMSLFVPDSSKWSSSSSYLLESWTASSALRAASKPKSSPFTRMECSASPPRYFRSSSICQSERQHLAGYPSIAGISPGLDLDLHPLHDAQNPQATARQACIHPRVLLSASQLDPCTCHLS